MWWVCVQCRMWGCGARGVAKCGPVLERRMVVLRG